MEYSRAAERNADSGRPTFNRREFTFFGIGRGLEYPRMAVWAARTVRIEVEIAKFK